MEVEPRGIEGPVVVVAICGLEVTGGVELGEVPEATSEVCKERKIRP